MCSCGNVNSVSSLYYPSPSPEVVENCEKTRTEIQDLYNRMVCVKSEVTGKTVNTYLGILLTMLNINQYCKYNTNEIEVYIIKYNC